MAEKTIFQKIMDGEVPGEKVYEDEQCAVLRDIDPQAPEHLLVVPRKVIPRLEKAEAGDGALLGHLLLTAGEVARREGFAEGFRVVINNGKEAGESVPHLHVHVLAGRGMGWPPG